MGRLLERTEGRKLSTSNSIPSKNVLQNKAKTNNFSVKIKVEQTYGQQTNSSLAIK